MPVSGGNTPFRCLSTLNEIQGRSFVYSEGNPSEEVKCLCIKMVFSCEYPGCFNIAKVLRLRAPTSTGEGRLTFHKFPVNDPERLRLWLLAIRWDVNTPVERVYKRMLCSEHFRSEDYKAGKSGSSRRLLKSSAVPVPAPAQCFQPKEDTTRDPVPAQPSLYCPATGEEEETDVQGASAFFEGVPRSTLIKQSNVEQSEGIVTRLIWTLTSPEALASKTRPSTSGTYIAFPPVQSYQSDKPTQTQPKSEENDVAISTLSLDLCPPCLRDSFVPTSSTSTSTPTTEEEREDGMWKERRWIVNESNLMGLFKRCQDCGALITETKKISSGGLVLVQWECEKGHLGQWNSSL